MSERASLNRVGSQGTMILALAFALATIIVAFYGTGFYNYFIPTVLQKKDLSLGIWTLTVIGGVSGFLSPCAFGMLTYLFAVHLSAASTSGNRERILLQSLRYGAASACGMITVAFVLAGLIFSLGATFAPSLRIVTPIPNVATQVIRIVGGVFLIFLGLQQLRGKSVIDTVGRFGRSAKSVAGQAMQGGRSPSFVFFVFGMLYVVEALPCMANVMAAPLFAAFAAHGIQGAVLAVVIFMTTMATCMLVASFCFGLANRSLIEQIRLARDPILKLAACLMVALGLTIVYLDLDTVTFRKLFFAFPIR